MPATPPSRSRSKRAKTPSCAGTFRASASTLVFAGHLKVYGADVNDRQAEDDEEGTVAAAPGPRPGRVLDAACRRPAPPPDRAAAALHRGLAREGPRRRRHRPPEHLREHRPDRAEAGLRRTSRAAQLVPQELGFIVNDLLEQHMKKYVDVPFTGEMEKELDEVADGRARLRPRSSASSGRASRRSSMRAKPRRRSSRKRPTSAATSAARRTS